MSGMRSFVSNRRYTLTVLLVACVVLTGAFALSYKYAKGSSVPTNDELYDTEYWKSRVDAVGAAAAYEEAVRSVPAGENLRVYHSVGHVVGAAIYESSGLDDMTVCDSRTVYGCLHEIMRLHLREHPQQGLEELADKCDEQFGELTWMCKHAIGHGLMAINGRSLDGLQTSLAQCDRVSTLDYLESCHAGAFMEFDYDLTVPGDMDTERPVENEEWYSPCDEIDGLYYAQCIRRRPYWWLGALGDEMPIADKYARMMSMCRDSRVSTKEARVQCINAIAIQITMLEGGSELARSRCASISETAEEKMICDVEYEKAVMTLIPDQQ